jgi:hypothetical protein
MLITEVVTRIDDVLIDNKRIEWTYIALTCLLFLTGIVCFIVALLMREFAWSIPSAIATALLHRPLKEIKDIRQKNIALAIAPVLITQLPTQEAAREIQKLLQNLYGATNDGG